MESDTSSVASSMLGPAYDSPTPDMALQLSVRKMLKSRIFLGRYVERRLVSETVGYRDLVLLSAAEEELQKELLKIRRQLVAHYSTSHWVGITDTELLVEYKPGVCLWTEIDDKPFGPFWFQIKSVEFRWNEVAVKVKCLRHITDRFLELEPLLVESRRAAETKSAEVKIESLYENYIEFVVHVKESLTLQNIKDCFVFVFALIIAILTGSFAFVSYLGTFVLSLLREVSLLVKNSTPIFLGCLDFISKIIGGFYILLAMLFRQTVPASAPDRYIQYPTEGSHRYKRNDYRSDYDGRNFD